MEPNWGIIGHQNIINYLENCLKRNRLVHAYLFYGIRHLGKTTVALKFAESLLSKQKGSHPDLFELKLDEDKKDISIEQVRDWQHWLTLKSFGDGYKVGIIHQAENLNIQSANALLKTIEEPTARTVLILITSNWAKLLPTIISRSQKIHFLPVFNKEIEKKISSKISDKKKLNQVVNFSLGRPGLAIKFSQDQDYFEEYLQFHQKTEALWQATLAERFDFLEKFLKGKNLSENANLAKKFLWHLEFIARNKLLEKYGTSEAGDNDSKNLVTILNLLNTTKQLIKKNVQPRLALENLLINL